MILYNLSDRVTAFTTSRNFGREAELLCPALNVPLTRFVRPHQVHGITVRTITDGDLMHPDSLLPHSSLLEGVDAVIYDVRNACIGISTADCIPVLCYDPDHHCAAAIHAGWKGTVKRIVEHTLHEMHRVFGTELSHLHCAIGPGISLDSFEVGDEVYDAFASAGFDMSALAKRYPAASGLTASHSPVTSGASAAPSNPVTSGPAALKWHIDLKECNCLQLMSLGVPPASITVSSIDTMTDLRFYSARREGASTGRILSGIVLR